LLVSVAVLKALVVTLAQSHTLKAYHDYNYLQVIVVEELKCPWCGTNFENARELDVHARNHYCKELIA
jgi:uncharacterized protein (UPF0212 family)